MIAIFIMLINLLYFSDSDFKFMFCLTFFIIFYKILKEFN